MAKGVEAKPPTTPSQTTAAVKKFKHGSKKTGYSLALAIAGEPPPVHKGIGVGRRGLNGRLSGLLQTIEQHFGRPVAISSGCRSRTGNRKAGGARNSYHMRCMAADITVAGVGEGQLLRFVSSLPGRGGVGTYCGNSVVHVDVGPRRNWSYGCRKKKRRK